MYHFSIIEARKYSWNAEGMSLRNYKFGLNWNEFVKKEKVFWIV